ncbi:MAG TPA: hypothetical protein VMU39_15885 [Solirubrobacteraceae bacterium]|nr:hypothetical protein [Solirubrobacteraceae bacterium]
MFGRRRKDDEDPFGALKDGGTYQSEPTVIPEIGDSGASEAPTESTFAPPPSEPGAPPPGLAQPLPGLDAPPPVLPPPTTQARPAASAGSGDQRRRAGTWGSGRVIALRIAIPAILIVLVAISASRVSHSVKSTSSVPSLSTPSSTPTTAPATPPVVSYLTPRGLRAGLAHVERIVPGARLALLRIDDRSLSTTAVVHGGAPKLVYFSPAATMVTGTASTGQTPIAISQIRPGAVGRIIAAMRARFHVPPSQIDYMVISSPPGLAPHWIIFSKEPARRGYSATLSGSNLTPLPG